MSQIILPDRVRHQIEFERQLEELNKRHDWLRYFDRELRALDPHLSLVRARENATEPGLVPGFWHIKRDNPTTLPTFYPLRDEKGGFAEPSYSHLEMMRRNDLQKPGAFEDFVKRQEAGVRAEEKKRELQAEERREEMAERIAHLNNPSVSMTEGWTNSVKGRRAK